MVIMCCLDLAETIYLSLPSRPAVCISAIMLQWSACMYFSVSHQWGWWNLFQETLSTHCIKSFVRNISSPNGSAM